MYLYSNKHNKAKDIFLRSLRYAQRKKDMDSEVLKCELAISIIDKTDNAENIEKLQLFKNDVSYYEHWYLASLGTSNKEYLQISNKLLNENAHLISDQKHQNSYLKNIKLHKILSSN